MPVTLDDKVIAAAFVALLIVGSAMAYLLVFNEISGDPRQDPHSYCFEGSLDGSACAGTGETRYVEHSGGCILHELDFAVESTDGSEHGLISLFFNEDGTMDGSYELVGDAEAGGTPCSLWTKESDGMEQRLYIGTDCTLLRIELESERLSLIGIIVRSMVANVEIESKN